MASLDNISRQISQLLASGLPAPAGIDAERHRQAVAYAADRYAQSGFAHYAQRLRWLGFADRARGLDLGSGAGHWCLAFAHYGGHATGVEMRPEFVAIAERSARAIGYGERVKFLTERIETAALPADSFEAAWSHGVLMYTDAEPAIAKAATSLAANGGFYLAYTVEGTRLDQIELGLLEGEAPDHVGPQLAIFLNGCLHRAGIYHTVAGRVRMLQLGDLRRICEVFGLSYVDEPGIQDLPGRYRGIPATVDLLTRKTASADAVGAALLNGRALTRAWLSELEELLQSDCPRLVCDVIAAVDPDLAEAAHHDLYARALIRAGRARGAPARRVFAGGRILPDFTKGLYAQDCERFDEALACYRRLGHGHPGTLFLAGCCLLQLGDREAARRVFRDAVESGRGGLQEWIGLVASHHLDGDLAGARDAFRAFLQTRD